jgi:4-hydroxy-tetrahydrodipicolinate synthase
MDIQDKKGVYAAAVTPLSKGGTPDLEAIPEFLAFLAKRGAHGALLLGTTGEGPSFATKERLAVFRAALRIREEYPDFRLLGGTGSPSLEETVELTQSAFDLGFDGVVTLPPYYYRDASEEGLFSWFSQVIKRSAPLDGGFLGYHFPKVSGVPLSLNLLQRLKDAFPNRFSGLKDSSGDPVRGQELGEHFGESLLVFTGNDRLLQPSLNYHGAGCITAAANLFSRLLRSIWDAHSQGVSDEESQGKLERGRQILEEYRPFAPAIKSIMARKFGLGPWPVRPPLIDLPPDSQVQLQANLEREGLLP